MWISKQINASVTVKQILKTCWFDYKETHTVTDYQVKEVEKALSCYDKEKGCFVYECKDCGDELTFFMYLKKEPPDPQKYLWMYEKPQLNC